MSYETFSDYCEISHQYWETFPKARKQHRCCECNRQIIPGEKYLAARGIGDGFWSESQCLDCRNVCMEVRDRLLKNSCLCFGELNEFLSENVFEISRDSRKDKHRFAIIRTALAEYLWSYEGRKPWFKFKKYPPRGLDSK